MSTILDRVAMFLQGEPTSQAIAALLAEAREDLARLDQERIKARNASVDPVATAAAAAKARAAVNDLAHEAERLGAGIERLEEQLGEAREREAEARGRELYERVKAETAALAKEFRPAYERLAGELVDLLARLEANEKAVSEANANRPKGAPDLVPAEHDLRGCGPDWKLRVLVKLRTFGGGAMLWPRRVPQVVADELREGNSEMIRLKNNARGPRGFYERGQRSPTVVEPGETKDMNLGPEVLEHATVKAMIETHEIEVVRRRRLTD